LQKINLGVFIIRFLYASNHETGIGKAFDKLTESDSNIVKELDKRAGDIPNGQNLKETLLEKAGQWKADAQIQRLAIDADLLSKAIKDALSNSY